MDNYYFLVLRLLKVFDENIKKTHKLLFSDASTDEDSIKLTKFFAKIPTVLLFWIKFSVRRYFRLQYRTWSHKWMTSILIFVFEKIKRLGLLLTALGFH